MVDEDETDEPLEFEDLSKALRADATEESESVRGQAFEPSNGAQLPTLQSVLISDPSRNAMERRLWAIQGWSSVLTKARVW